MRRFRSCDVRGRDPRRACFRAARGAVRLSALLLAVLLATSCAGPQRGAQRTALAPQPVGGVPLAVDASIPGDRAADSLIAPYRATVAERMNEPLAISPVPMERGNPEGTLGALVADIVLARARIETGLPVDVCVLNNGGLRIPWPAGVITLGLVYEVMPFDNLITVVRISAAEMDTLANEIASHDGEPVSGLSLRIVKAPPKPGETRPRQAASDVKVGGVPLAGREYWVATHDYLASGGGGLSALWEPLEKRVTSVFVRDAIADGLREYGARRRANGELGELPVPQMGRIVEEAAR
jgi:2',3'-cyclic-nucleotide 2'-phosphodiesterase (5'-nucleotidase family)